MEDDWQEVGSATPSIDTADDLFVVPNPESNDQYKKITTELKTLHAQLLVMEREGKLSNAVENPGLVGDYLQKLRLNVNMLYAFLNNYIDVLNDMEVELANKRQSLYMERLSQPKGTPSSADTHSKSVTRIDEVNVKQVKNRIDQIKNDYERFNGLCIMLQSRMKEFNTERIMG